MKQSKGPTQKLASKKEGSPYLKVTEAQLREQIRDLCKVLGWHFYFTWTSIHSPKGFPDLVLAHPGKKRILFAELKSEKGVLTEYQEQWLETLSQCGEEVYLWRPSQIDEIAGVLMQ